MNTSSFHKTNHHTSPAEIPNCTTLWASQDLVGSSSTDLTAADPVSEYVVVLVRKVVTCGIGTPLAAFGFGANIINFIVLLMQGVHDSATVSLLALTLADFAYVTLTLAHCGVCFLEAAGEPLLASHWLAVFTPQGIMLQFLCARISSALTAVISVERCWCVMWPLRAKTLVTRRCTVWTIVIIYVFVTATFVPVLLMYQVKWLALGNDTTLSAVPFPSDFYLSDFEFLSKFSDTINSVLYPISSLVIISVCTLLTTLSLKVSAKWRNAVTRNVNFNRKATSESSLNAKEKHLPVQMQANDVIRPDRDQRSRGSHFLPVEPEVCGPSQSIACISGCQDLEAKLPDSNNVPPKVGTKDPIGLSDETGQKPSISIQHEQQQREMKKNSKTSKQLSRSLTNGGQQASQHNNLRLTRLLVAIATIHIVCLLTNVVATTVRLFIPQFSLNRRYHNSFYVVAMLQFFLDTFSASITFVVYMIMSSRFRRTFRKLVSCPYCRRQ